MIEKTAAYKTVDGTTHATLEEAQKHALSSLIGDIGLTELMANADEVIAILKLKPRKARVAKKAKAPKADKPAKVA